MEINSKLFDKTIDLKKSSFIGGRSGSTESKCTTYEYYYINGQEVYDMTITYTDDNGFSTSVTIEGCCPD